MQEPRQKLSIKSTFPLVLVIVIIMLVAYTFDTGYLKRKLHPMPSASTVETAIKSSFDVFNRRGASSERVWGIDINPRINIKKMKVVEVERTDDGFYADILFSIEITNTRFINMEGDALWNLIHESACANLGVVRKENCIREQRFMTLKSGSSGHVLSSERKDLCEIYFEDGHGDSCSRFSEGAESHPRIQRINIFSRNDAQSQPGLSGFFARLTNSGELKYYVRPARSISVLSAYFFQNGGVEISCTKVGEFLNESDFRSETSDNTISAMQIPSGNLWEEEIRSNGTVKLTNASNTSKYGVWEFKEDLPGVCYKYSGSGKENCFSLSRCRENPNWLGFYYGPRRQLVDVAFSIVLLNK